MNNETKKKLLAQGRDPLHPDRQLVSRRDFLSSGAIGFTGTMMLPTLFTTVFMERAARAGECAAGSAGSSMIRSVIFDLAGGANLTSQVAVGDAPGKFGSGFQLLPDYSNLGLNNPNSFVAADKYGMPMAKAPELQPNSPFVSQLYLQLEMLPPEIQAKVRVGFICYQSLSDTGQGNYTSPVGLITMAGLKGSKLPNGLGMRNSPSAGNSDGASIEAGAKPMAINRVGSLTSALGFNAAFAGLPTRVKEAVGRGLVRLSESHARKIASMDGGTAFGELAKCGFVSNMQYASDAGAAGVDPRLDPVVAQIYGINANTNDGDENAVVAAILKNSIEGNVGCGVVTLGGYDYHDGTAQTAINQHNRCFAHLRRGIQIAAAENQPCIFYFISDGGTYTDPGTNVHRGDSNGKSGCIVIVFDPRGPRNMLAHQIGRYTVGQDADRAEYIATDTKRAAHALFLNYLALNGMVDKYEQIAIRDQIPARMRDSLLLFEDKA